MFNGKRKAVTFSYDDGVTQDQRLIALLGKYGLKAIFNINSGLLCPIWLVMKWCGWPIRAAA